MSSLRHHRRLGHRAILISLSLLLAIPVVTPVQAHAAPPREELDERIAEIMHRYDLDETRLAYAYRPADSDDEVVYNEDALFQSASVYKLPLNMYYYELEAAGLIESDELVNGYRLDICHEQSLVYSNNELSEGMINAMGGYRDFKESIAAYSGADLEAVDGEYFWNSVFSAKMLLETLQYLYNDTELFSECIYYMKQAQPEQYIKGGVTEYEVAQKYGYRSDEDGSIHIAVAGIVYTPEPFLLVILTNNVWSALELMSELAAAFCDYSLALGASNFEPAPDSIPSNDIETGSEPESDLKTECQDLVSSILPSLIRLASFLSPPMPDITFIKNKG